MATAKFPGNSNYQVELSASVDGATITVTVKVRRLTGTGYWTAENYPWQIDIDGQIYKGEWTYDFRNGVSLLTVKTQSRGGRPNGRRRVAAWVEMQSSIGRSPIVTEYVTVNVVTVPGTTPTPTVTASRTSLAASWSAPSSGGSAITGYEVMWNTSASASGASSATQGTTRSRAITGLRPNRDYYTRVRARNSSGWGEWSPWRKATTLTTGAPGFTVTPSVDGKSATVQASPPSGVGSGDIDSYTIERRLGASGAATQETYPTFPQTFSGLQPGGVYQWRMRANVNGYDSPWSDWASATQPRPNTNPGDYFDGSSAATADEVFQWTGAVGASTSRAVGKLVSGWTTFATSSGNSGGTGVVQRVTAQLAENGGSHAARVTFFSDATSDRFSLGSAYSRAATVVAGETYVGSIFVSPSRAQRLACVLAWINAAGSTITTSMGEAEIVEANGVARLVVTGVAPEGAVKAVPRANDVKGEGWSTWKAGDQLTVDAAMITLAELFPYFDGDTPTSNRYEYAWEGDPNASPSFRIELEDSFVDPLLDPLCPPIPAPPTPPSVDNDCVDEIGVWRRYWAIIGASEVSRWIAALPTFTITAGDEAVNQLRIRVYPNPDGLAPAAIGEAQWDSEQIISYIPPQTTLTIDGVSSRAWADVPEYPTLPADHLLYGTGNTPPSWPVLRCGIGYLIAFDAPITSDPSNVSIQVALTERMG